LEWSAACAAGAIAIHELAIEPVIDTCIYTIAERYAMQMWQADRHTQPSSVATTARFRRAYHEWQAMSWVEFCLRVFVSYGAGRLGMTLWEWNLASETSWMSAGDDFAASSLGMCIEVVCSCAGNIVGGHIFTLLRRCVSRVRKTRKRALSPFPRSLPTMPSETHRRGVHGPTLWEGTSVV